MGSLFHLRLFREPDWSQDGLSSRLRGMIIFLKKISILLLYHSYPVILLMSVDGSTTIASAGDTQGHGLSLERCRCIFTGGSSENTHRCHLSHRCDDVWQCTMLLLPTFSGNSIISEKIFGLYLGFSFTFFVRRVDRTHKNCTMCFAHSAMFSFYISIQIPKLSGIMSLCLVRRCRWSSLVHWPKHCHCKRNE